MIRAVLALMLLVAFTAEDCGIDFEGIVNRPGTITITNLSTTETAVIALLADDAKSYPTLGPGASATVTTNVGGVYQVRVVMTPEAVIEYRAELTAIRRLLEKAVDGAASAEEKTKLFVDLAAVKAAIRGAASNEAAGCSGRITLNTEAEERTTATVRWIASSSGGGFWDVTCGGN